LKSKYKVLKYKPKERESIKQAQGKMDGRSWKRL
jgi:hypothetical protein